MQVDAGRPTAAPNAPHAHGTHAALDVLPELGLYRPAEQKTHAALELLPVLGLNEPAAHARQAALELLPALGLNFPAVQAVQLALPEAPAYLPAGQSAQDGSPGRAAKVPCDAREARRDGGLASATCGD